FNGLGKSLPPSIVSISLNLLRIPSALIFSTLIGLNGIWWSISGSSILKGTILVIWFAYYFRKKYKTNNS
ncbi:MAG TPA: MATE family efflux transporter, partial [Candidatus Cloacimonadota bacterium]|nr:MATE family efflux transporter [Candidatus Cloacimonadota bacterium]